MTGDTNPEDLIQKLPFVPSEGWMDQVQEVPVRHDVLPDGRESVLIGDVERCKEFNHPQGENSFGFRDTAGLVSCENILRQFGIDVTEDDVVRFAVENGLCDVNKEPNLSGGSTPFSQAMILKEHDVPAHVEVIDSAERLADCVEHGHGVIIGVNAGVLWNDANAFDNGQANISVVVTGVARDPQTGDIQGFFVNDTGRDNPKDSGFLDAAIKVGWEIIASVITDVILS